MVDRTKTVEVANNEFSINAIKVRKQYYNTNNNTNTTANTNIDIKSIPMRTQSEHGSENPNIVER